jgi:hypothetical protein
LLVLHEPCSVGTDGGWLLLVVAAGVAASSGALLVPHPAPALTVLIFSYVL